MSRFRMMLPERLGLIVLAIMLLGFAVLLLTRGCGADHPKPLVPEPALIDSVSKAHTDSIEHKSRKKKTKRTKKAKSTKSTLQPYERHHLDEPAN